MPALPGEIVFLDDSPHNVAAAAELGIAAHRVDRGDDLAALFGDGGIVPAGLDTADIC